MSWQEWDRDLDALARDLAKVRCGTSQVLPISAKTMQERKIAIVQAQVNINRKMERIAKLQTRDLLLLPREHTFVHWSGILCERIQKLLPLAVTTNSKKLWANLIALRLGDPTQERKPQFTYPDDLMELSVRKAQLSKTELRLNRSLVSIDQKRKDLYARYSQLDVKQAMSEASGSIQGRLGTDWQHAMSGPVMTALGDFLSSLNPAKANSRWDRNMDRLEKKSHGIMRLAQQFITGFAEGHTPSRRKKARFQSMLSQLTALEADTRASLHRQSPHMRPSASTFVVQKSPKDART